MQGKMYNFSWMAIRNWLKWDRITFFYKHFLFVDLLHAYLTRYNNFEIIMEFGMEQLLQFLSYHYTYIHSYFSASVSPSTDYPSVQKMYNFQP